MVGVDGSLKFLNGIGEREYFFLTAFELKMQDATDFSTAMWTSPMADAKQAGRRRGNRTG